jgi:glutamate synthase (NADPH/NADH) small chain
VLKTDYGQQEAIQQFGKDPRVYQTTVTGFLADEKGRVRAAITQKLQPVKDEKTGRTLMKPVEGSEQEVAVDLVLIAAGFLGCQGYIAQAFGVECNERTNVKTSPGSHKTNVDRVFTAGDMHRGQSLVVWAIAEGRAAAAQVDESMMGYTNL